MPSALCLLSFVYHLLPKVAKQPKNITLPIKGMNGGKIKKKTKKTPFSPPRTYKLISVRTEQQGLPIFFLINDLLSLIPTTI